MNKTIIIGNLGKPPEMRYTPQGEPITNFSVAVNRKYTKAGAKVSETTWFRCTAWSKQAEICNKYLKKGSKVLIEGRLVCDAQTGGPKVWSKQDGTSGATFELSVQNVEFLSPMESDGGMQSEEGAELLPQEDIPF